MCKGGQSLQPREEDLENGLEWQAEGLGDGESKQPLDGIQDYRGNLGTQSSLS